MKKILKQPFFLSCLVVTVLFILYTLYSLSSNIAKRTDIDNLIPPIYKNTDIQTVPKHSEFTKENYVPLEVATFSDGKTAIAYKLPYFIPKPNIAIGVLSLLDFSDSSILFSKNSLKINDLYYGNIELYDVHTKEFKTVLEVDKLKGHSKIEFHMNKEYVVIDLGEVLYIYDKKTDKGAETSLNSITFDTSKLPSSLDINDTKIASPNNTYELDISSTDNSVYLHDLKNNEKFPINLGSEFNILETQTQTNYIKENSIIFNFATPDSTYSDKTVKETYLIIIE